MCHLFILVLYLLVYEVLFNWIITPGKKEQTLSITKIILIIFSCGVDVLLYFKWISYTEGDQSRETDFPETVSNLNLIKLSLKKFHFIAFFTLHFFSYLKYIFLTY